VRKILLDVFIADFSLGHILLRTNHRRMDRERHLVVSSGIPV
jgi:hypothetical protein